MTRTMRPKGLLALLVVAALTTTGRPVAAQGAPGDPAGDPAPPPVEPAPVSAYAGQTLAACIRTAWEKHPDVRKARVAIARAADEARAARGAYGPTLTTEANVMVWDEELTSSFGGGEMPSIDPPGPGQTPESGFDLYIAETLGQLGSLLESFGSMSSLTIRDQVTWGVTLRLTQPLTPLWQVYHGHQARLEMVDQQEVHRETVRSDVALSVATAFYAALQADEYVVIAESAVAQLDAHLEQARAFYENGVIGKNDVLKVEVEKANAEQQVIQAQAGRDIALANLATQMGLPASQPVQPSGGRPGGATTLPQVDVTLTAAVEEAIGRRTELVEITHGIQAADHGAVASWWALVPQVVLVGQYDHVGGQGTFAKEDTFFAGLMLSWDVWQWGQTYYAAEAADGQVEELRIQRERLEQLLQLDVTAKYHRLRSAEKAFRVSLVAIDQAEEALRIERERFGAQVATSTDVLDAESNLTRAQANRVNAYYAYLLARAELLRAMGRPIVPASAGGERGDG